MTDIGPTGYMNDGQIMAWLEEKSADQYGHVTEEMDTSNDRSKLIRDLTDAQASVDGGDPDAAYDKLVKTLPDCPDTKTQVFVYEQEIGLLGWVQGGNAKADAIEASINASQLSDADKQALMAKMHDAHKLMDSRDTNYDGDKDKDLRDANTKLHDEQKQRVSGALKSCSDNLGHIDQLALIDIQQLVSDAKQTAELASNILSSYDQTRMGIVGNVRG